MYEQFDFEFRYQADATSFYVPLLKYLQKRSRRDSKTKKTEFSREQMILWALSAFWYPLACKWLGGFTEAELKQLARNAVYELQKQINYLSQVFGLDLQEVYPTRSFEASSSSNRQQAVADPRPTVPPAVASIVSLPLDQNLTLDSEQASTTQSLSVASEILVCSGDDDLLKEAFDK